MVIDYNHVLGSITNGLLIGYFHPLVRGDVPVKEVLYELQSDLEIIIITQEPLNEPKITQKLVKYKEIVDILAQIPEEDLMREKDLTESLRRFSEHYWAYSFFVHEGVTRMMPHKLDLLAQSVKLKTRINIGENGHLKQMVELAEKYFELLKIDYPTGKPSADS